MESFNNKLLQQSFQQYFSSCFKDLKLFVNGTPLLLSASDDLQTADWTEFWNAIYASILGGNIITHIWRVPKIKPITFDKI